MRAAILLSGFTFLCSLASAAPGQPQGGSYSNLPVVDLGYELHQASFYNVCLNIIFSPGQIAANLWQQTGNFYNFSNVDQPYDLHDDQI